MEENGTLLRTFPLWSDPND